MGSVSHKKCLVEERHEKFVDGRCNISYCISWKTGNGTGEQIQSLFLTLLLFSFGINCTNSPEAVGILLLFMLLLSVALFVVCYFGFYVTLNS